MKKHLALLLAVLFLFTACSSVSENSGAESENPESSESQTSQSTSSEVSEEEYTGERRYTLVSVGKPYTTTYAANETYPDLYGQQITDGLKTPNIGAHYVDTRMVGYTATKCSFQIDLGEDGKNIDRIVARSLVMAKDGVVMANSATFGVSNDGIRFSDLGTVQFVDTGDMTVSEAVLELENDLDYRYVRVTINRQYGHFFFTDEVEVYANVAPEETEDFAALAYENESIDRQAWHALSTDVAVSPEDTAIISRNCKYTFADCEFDSRALQNDTMLTDGTRTNQYFSNPVWVGITPKEGKNASLTVALDKLYTNVYGFKVHALGSGIDVEYPAYIDIYASQNGSKYVFVGRMYGPRDGDNFVYSFVLPEYINARNVRFVFPEGTGSYWIEEIEVIAGYNEEQPDVLYPPLDFPEVTEEILWDSSEADYSKVQNLLLGRPQQISALFYADINTRGDESPVDFPYLTDGKRAEDLYCYGGEWFFSRCSDGIEFIFDLEKLSSVSSVNVSLLEQTEWGISRPKYMSVFLSEDAENWYEVAEYTKGDAVLNSSATRLEIPLDFQNTYAARFVRVRIESGFLFMDELEAIGTKEVGSETLRLSESGINPVPLYTNPESEAFATSENTPIKADHITLLLGNTMTAETILPYVAYLDEEGNIKDTFMDGFLYCFSGTLPSGGYGHTENYKQDWEYVYDITFNGTGGFDVLEKTVQTVKDTLNIPDYKVQVYVTFPAIMESVADFGDVDGDGVTENLSDKEDIRQVIDWYMDLCMTEFTNRGYKNLELGGFYWVNEAVRWESDDSHIISVVAEQVHKNGSYFLWIPYYTANRFYTGYELGFDLISMQPNVVFTTDAPLWRFDSTVALTKARKMCVEIEHSYQAMGDIDFARSYMLYLYYGAVTGYMDAVNIYYDDTDNFARMAYSKDELCRYQYDSTYHYAKGDLDVTPDTKETLNLNGSQNQIISGDLNEADEIAKFTLVTPPEHGYISMGTDGTFRYFPEKGYTGTDSFTYTYNQLLGESEECTVEITIE